jgi:spermidine synthase
VNPRRSPRSACSNPSPRPSPLRKRRGSRVCILPSPPYEGGVGGGFHTVSRPSAPYPLFLLLIGFTAAIAQLLLLRELVAVFYGNELLLGLILAAWMACVALGTGPLAARIGRAAAGPRLAAALMAGAALLPAQMALIRRLPAWLTPATGVQVAPGPAALATIAVLLPLCVALGAQFALGAQGMEEAGRGARRAYLYESVGAVLGGALFSLGLVRWLDPFQTALGIGSFNLLAGLFLLSAGAPRRRFLWLLLPLSLVSLPLGHRLHLATLRAQCGPDLVAAVDSPYGRLTALARGEQRIVYENGLLVFETQSIAPEATVYPPLLAHPAPRSVLLAGGVAAGDLRLLLQHPVRRVIAIESDAQLLRLARQTLPPAASASLDDPRVAIALDDARRFVQATGETFDVALLDLPEPATGALNRFYTLEFYTAIRARLAEEGMLALRLPSAENYWSLELARRNASIYRTLRQVFPYVTVLPGESDTYLASSRPLNADPAVWSARLAQRGLHPAWVTPIYLADLLHGDRRARTLQTLESATGARLNRDSAPICYYYDLALWFTRFYPGLRPLFEQTARLRWWWPALPLLLLAALARRRRALAVPLIVGIVGFGGMALNLALLLCYQAQHGTLYQGVGLLMAAFMGGHALGLWLSDRLQPQASAPVLPLTLLAEALAAGGMAWIVTLALPVPLFVLLGLLVGGATGAVYPLALARLPGDPAQSARRLYAADLLGGCVGALIGGTLLVPLLGLPQTCLVTVLALLAGAAAVR